MSDEIPTLHNNKLGKMIETNCNQHVNINFNLVTQIVELEPW